MNLKVKDLCLMAISLAILIISSKISFNLGVITLTLQTLSVSLISFILKWKRASLVFLTYIVMGLIGIPVFSTGGGYQYIYSLSFGFIIGFFLSSFIFGSNILSKYKWTNIIKGILGLAIIDISGLVYMYIIFKYYNNQDVSFIYVIEVGLLPFIIKDLVSVVLSSIIAIRLEPAIENIGIYNKELIKNDNHE